MKIAKDIIRVKFIVFQGDIVALFPDIPWDIENRYISSYQRIGQHGAANKNLIYCKAATPDQYASLLNEIKSLGYTDINIMNKGK